MSGTSTVAERAAIASWRSGLGVALSRSSSSGEPAKDNVEDWREEQAEESHTEHTAENRDPKADTHSAPAQRSGASGGSTNCLVLIA
jgi:hypothetical protein